MSRRIIGPKFYAARGDETTGPYLELWRAFQSNNERYRPGGFTRSSHAVCLVSNVGYGNRRGGCLQHLCPACGTPPWGERIFDHEESWHVKQGERRVVVRFTLDASKPCN